MTVINAGSGTRTADGGRLGPLPSPPRNPVPSVAQAAVLHQLAELGAFQTVAALAASSGQHPNTVREHLESLVEAGLVDRRSGVASGRGRPAHEYRTRRLEESQPAVREYAALASALASHIARTSADPSADALAAGTDWGHQLARTVRRAASATPATRGAGAARRHVVQIMDDLGFAPDADRSAGTVRLRRCPLLATAELYPAVVCGVHLGLVRGVLDQLGGDPTSAHLTPFAEVGACRLELAHPGSTS